jgi:hypothetical protein
MVTKVPSIFRGVRKTFLSFETGFDDGEEGTSQIARGMLKKALFSLLVSIWNKQLSDHSDQMGLGQ